MEAAVRWPEVLSVSLHPGLVRTDIGRGTALRFVFRYAPLLIEPEKAALRLVRLATVPVGELTGGAMYGAGKPIQLSAGIFNKDMAGRLWASSEAVVAGWA